MILRWLAVLFGTMFVLSTNAAAGNRTLTGLEMQRLLATGGEGTTILFTRTSDKIFFSTGLTNQIRRSEVFGLNLVRERFRPDTVAEGVFMGASKIDGKTRMITGVAALSVSKTDGAGTLILVETFADDTSEENFERNSRLYSIFRVEESDTGLVCQLLPWRRLGGPKPEGDSFELQPCEFTVGNSAVPWIWRDDQGKPQ